MIARIIFVAIMLYSLVNYSVHHVFKKVGTDEMPQINDTLNESIDLKKYLPNETVNVSGNPIQDMKGALDSIPWSSIKNYLFAGITGVVRWINYKVLTPLLTYALRYATRNPDLVLNPIVGYLSMIALIVVIAFWKGQYLIDFIMRSMVWIAVIVIIVFLIGVILSATGSI